MHWARRLVDRVKKLDVEPVLFVYFFTVTCYSMGASNLVTQKICFPDTPPGVDVVCNDTLAFNRAADLNQIKTIIREVVPAFAVILAGSWRDVTGRSLPLILLGLSGELLAMLTELTSAVYWQMSPTLTVLLASASTALGSGKVLTMASFSYVTQRTTAQERSSRMSLVIMALLGSACLAMIVSGVLLSALDYSYFFLLLIALTSFSVFLGLLLVEDRSIPRTPDRSFLHSVGRMRLAFTSSGRNNSVIWSFILSLVLINGLFTAEGSVNNLFLQTKFKYTPKEIGFLSGYKMTIYIAAVALVNPIFEKVLKISEFKIVGICAFFGIVTSVAMAFVETAAQLYIVASLDFLRVTLISTIWSLFSKCVKKSEIGMYTSLESFGEGIIPLFISPLYVYTFEKTIAVLPGTFYLISAATILLSALLIWMISLYYEEAEDDCDGMEPIESIPADEATEQLST